MATKKISRKEEAEKIRAYFLDGRRYRSLTKEDLDAVEKNLNTAREKMKDARKKELESIIDAAKKELENI